MLEFVMLSNIEPSGIAMKLEIDATADLRQVVEPSQPDVRLLEIV
jgi:hypothetical protein